MNNVEYKQQNSLYPKRAQLPQVNNNFENQVIHCLSSNGGFLHVRNSEEPKWLTYIGCADKLAVACKLSDLLIVLSRSARLNY